MMVHYNKGCATNNRFLLSFTLLFPFKPSDFVPLVYLKNALKDVHYKHYWMLPLVLKFNIILTEPQTPLFTRISYYRSTFCDHSSIALIELINSAKEVQL